ncbi:hypothetical protein C8F04DRAFT_1034990 [Mycena alexandri]|uniref:Uncharacterized protein n=1 Tax=Mycena alexandri TaxID=1745969 RepID=A0AAD6X7J7_9AGAR|nr:hypothetical protein C8F04DRAFT_1034990 [Mycena alexandri]
MVVATVHRRFSQPSLLTVPPPPLTVPPPSLLSQTFASSTASSPVRTQLSTPPELLQEPPVLTHEELVSAQTNFEIVAPKVYATDRNHRWITDSKTGAQALFQCLEQGDCGQNQTKVVLISSHDYIVPLQGGSVGGEAVWALSTYRALQEMGYTVLFGNGVEAVSRMYKVFDSLVMMVIANAEQAFGCFKTNCVRSETNPNGIPAWKIFSSHFWQGQNNPLGSKWTLSPEDVCPYGFGNTYLGYSIEAQCSKHAFVPYAQRKRQVYVLAKHLKFFLPKVTAWPPSYFDEAANATGLGFVMASRDLPDGPRLGPADLSTSIRNFGADAMRSDTFYDLLSHSVALVGVGNPALSPTPYDALCLGVPFINPINQWNKKDPEDRKEWQTQHGALKVLSPPYVYHVFKGDREGFVNAIREAAANPIESYVLERMKMASVKDRLGKILAHDWKEEAAVLLKARQEGSQKGSVFTL